MLSWLGGLFGLPALAGVLQSIINFLTATVAPLLVKALELVSWLLSTLWEGFKDIVDNAATVFTALFIALCAWFYGAVPAKLEKAQCEKRVEVQKVYIQKQCKPKVIYKKSPEPDFKWPWE